jgi:hypothetical protein
MGITGLQNPATQGRQSVQQVLYIPSVSFNWLILDLGGRLGHIGAAARRHCSLPTGPTTRHLGRGAAHGARLLRLHRLPALLQAQRTTLEEQKVKPRCGGRPSPRRRRHHCRRPAGAHGSVHRHC